jgi:hypothetical protein
MPVAGYEKGIALRMAGFQVPQKAGSSSIYFFVIAARTLQVFGLYKDSI